MKKIILHIGRHKSGTSSIQQFLKNNAQLLNDNGYYYLDKFLKGFGHHHLAEPYAKSKLRKLSEAEIQYKIKESRVELLSALSDNKINIISSEAFQNVDPLIVKKIFEPDKFDVKIVCYFRDQASYLASSYNQRVHATNYSESIDYYYQNNFSANYHQFAVSWVNCFDDYYFGVFEKEKLISNDVVADFCYRILEIDLPQNYNFYDGNPSLGCYLLEMKRSINLYTKKNPSITELTNKDIYKIFSKISRSQDDEKFTIDTELYTKVMAQYSASNQLFFKDFAVGHSFSSKPPKNTKSINISECEILSMLDYLNKFENK